MKSKDFKEIVRWILTIISAILAGLGTESCIAQTDLANVFQQYVNLLT